LIQENPQEKIFVHRRLGDDRTGMAMAAYRMAIEGWFGRRGDERDESPRVYRSPSRNLPGAGALRKKFPAPATDRSIV
jgi:hypothetical protein